MVYKNSTQRLRCLLKVLGNAHDVQVIPGYAPTPSTIPDVGCLPLEEGERKKRGKKRFNMRILNMQNRSSILIGLGNSQGQEELLF